MILNPNEISLASVSLLISDEEEKSLADILSPEEIERANRFRFPIHRKRFIAARGFLRKLLGIYLGLTPEQIVFSYSDHGKPSLFHNELQFNVSHSHDLAVFALAKHDTIGVDIEKVEAEYDDAVAKRFFSEEEYSNLHALPLSERTEGFYRIWARKEAVIKLSGRGMSMGLQSFSVPVAGDDSARLVKFTQSHEIVYVQGLYIDKGYQAALALYQKPMKIISFTFPHNTHHTR